MKEYKNCNQRNHYKVMYLVKCTNLHLNEICAVCCLVTVMQKSGGWLELIMQIIFPKIFTHLIFQYLLQLF